MLLISNYQWRLSQRCWRPVGFHLPIIWRSNILGQKIQKRHVLPLSLTLVTKIILEDSFNSNDYLTVASLLELAKAKNVNILETARSDFVLIWRWVAFAKLTRSVHRFRGLSLLRILKHEIDLPTFLFTFQKGLSCSLPSESRISVV